MQEIFDSINAGFKWLLDFFMWIVTSFVVFINDLVVTIINFLILAISMLIDLILKILPDSPFLNISFGNSSGLEYLGFLDFVIPFSFIKNVMGAWLIAMVVYYGLKVVLRYTKLTT